MDEAVGGRCKQDEGNVLFARLARRQHKEWIRGTRLMHTPPFRSLLHVPTGATDNAQLHFARDPWDLYAVGYRDAANILAKHITETENHLDTVLYPMLFLYRHYVELRCKWIIIYGSEYLGEPKLPETIHPFHELWTEARGVICRVWDQPGTSESLVQLDEVIAELSFIDPRSTSTRYPVEKDMKTRSIASLKWLNPGVIKSVMVEVASDLDAACTGIKCYLSDRCEWEVLERKLQADWEAEWDHELQKLYGREYRGLDEEERAVMFVPKEDQ